MSDDKREKLREYLKNNRPKNSVNLNYSSNNKENFTENLKKDSDLNKRDYNKEPLIITNYDRFFSVISLYMSFIAIFILTILSIFVFHLAIEKVIFYIAITILPIKGRLKIVLNSQKDSYFEFTNSCIRQKNTINIIEINSIKNIVKTFDSSNSLYKIEANKYIVFIGLLFCFVAFINYIKIMEINIFYAFLFFITIFFISLIPQIILNLKLGEREINIYTNLAIFSDDKIINIFVPSKNVYNELKKYFLLKTGKNLDYSTKQFKLIKFT
ncbi:hypothetical protein [Campylobacter ureolyticus]|uniref:Uncharacterized protein n=1 Tax=Campylobacter ureolyticus TaxID=827 RepID=A0A9Q4KLS4_9BACT|nr:hypothetical protein [Campylobacter ureolyticus]MCZ6104338.1 hypothetical protein [Campylobacter ureolyticus]MCZ6135497.1 hypothetical protein [Campylobacter ureolyticus]MCZ6162451.1 hypothetical protein [Campylobacter ureolyticus]MCZ6171507.1 hypothetical protein [Campylobacter ureolyticus]